jgi:uncharacterized protein YndB with AHSA1/START domain
MQTCVVRAEDSKDLLASREQVWAFLAEPYHLSDWWPGIASVQPDRRGLAHGARWTLVGGREPTLFRKSHATNMLIVGDVQPFERVSFHLLAQRLDVEIVLAVIDSDRTRVTVAVEGPWRPEAMGRPRALPRHALARLHALLQTAASL